MGPDADLRLDAVISLRGLELGALGSGLLDGQRSWTTVMACAVCHRLSPCLFLLLAGNSAVAATEGTE